MIPIPLLKRVIELLEYWDVSKYDRSIQSDYDDVLRALNVKVQKLDLRNAYARIISANNQDDRDDARINYLWRKSLLKDFDSDE
jgi:hypothetical protein